MNVPFVDLQAAHAELEDELRAAVNSVLQSGDFILGEAVETFEQEWAAYCDVRHAVATDSGMSALELALRAFGIGSGDEVITTANTFVATVFAIIHAGATPVLVDVDPDTHTMDPELLEAAITARTRAILPVHLYGQAADMDAVSDIADEHGLVVIEDACQAHGARYHTRRAGGLGHAAAFSFYPAKNLGALGDGGIVTTNDEGAAARLRILRNYGQQEKYEHVVVGFNRRLDTVHAAVLSTKLRRLDQWNERRRACATAYEELLADAGLVTPCTASGNEHVWHLYVVRSEYRELLRQHLHREGISVGIHYPTPVHLQAACRGLGYPAGRFPVTELAASQILSLPMYPGLERSSIERVAGAVHEFDWSVNGAGALRSARAG